MCLTIDLYREIRRRAEEIQYVRTCRMLLPELQTQSHLAKLSPKKNLGQGKGSAQFASGRLGSLAPFNSHTPFTSSAGPLPPARCAEGG